MEQNKEYKSVRTAPLWIPTGCDRVDFTAGMQFHAPFIFTVDPGQTDLGQCIICTFPPHLVFKVHPFRTNPQSKRGNDKELQNCMEMEEERIIYLQQRYQAIKNGQEAAQKKKSVKKIIREDRGGQYDQELDEPRAVGKIPGMNIYIELVGCLDKIKLEELDWNGERGVYWTMDYALSYALNFYKRDARRKAASKMSDQQPLPSWQEEWDEEARPAHQPHNGLGYTNIDPSRRRDNEKETRMLEKYYRE